MLQPASYVPFSSADCQATALLASSFRFDPA
jgi:hypothetical protein